MTPGHDGFAKAEVLENEPPRRRFPRSLMLATGAALVVVTGVSAAAAFTPSPAPTPSAAEPGKDAPAATPLVTPSEKARGHGWGWGWGRRHGMGGAVHGEYVVPDGQGGYLTVATQYGEVTAVGQDSITVRSEDGHTKEYAVDADTRVRTDGAGVGSLAAGDKVMVKATVRGDTATAVSVFDVTAWTERTGPKWRDKSRWHHRMPGGPDPTPAPSPTMTS